MKFIKKAIPVEVQQFNPDAKPHHYWVGEYVGVSPTSYEEVHQLIGTNGCSKESPYWTWDCMGTVTTIHGQKTIVVPGDYIMPEPDGIHFYPCKPDIFEKNYRLVTEADIPYNANEFSVNPVLFVDLDGTIRRSKTGKTFVSGTDDIELMPGVEKLLWIYKKWAT